MQHFNVNVTSKLSTNEAIDELESPLYKALQVTPSLYGSAPKETDYYVSEGSKLETNVESRVV